MKKLFTMLLILISIFYFNLNNVFALNSEDIYSNEALVVNMKTDEILFSKNTVLDSVEIASLTKIMTYVVVIESLDDLSIDIVVPDGTRQDIINKNGSNAGLEDGYEYTALDLLYGLMLPSGCDAADVLAKYISNNDYSAFINIMNEKAKELDMNDTLFYSASGLSENDQNNVSTEQDLYKLAKYAFELPYFKEIISTEFYEIVGIKDGVEKIKTVRNTNYLMGEYNGAEYYYQYSLGGKTGNTSGAGRCLISYSKKGELELVAITLGVPNEHSNYHLTDHIKLFDYVYNEYSDNILVDIGSEYKSVEIGGKIQITATTSEDTNIIWKSSDDSIASVNEYGVVTGKKLGQVKITATTSTGNWDYSYVSVGFYNGIDVKYSSGPKDENGILGYGKIDWKLVKDYGMDYAVIRAGYALRNNPDSDPYFVTNIKDAIENNINIMISFDGYATDEFYAIKEADYLVNYLNENISEYLDSIELPIVYNLFNSSVSDPNLLVKVIESFTNRMNEYGYDIVVELGRTKFSSLDLKLLQELGVNLYVAWRPYVPDFTTQMNILQDDTIYNAMMWSYRTDGYFGEIGITKAINMGVMYMDYFDINTSHGKYDDNLYPEKPVLEIDDVYKYNGELLEANVSGYDSNTMDIIGNKAIDAGIYTISVRPKVKWKNGSTEEIFITWEIEKIDPHVVIPNLSAKKGTVLKDVELPANWVWKNENEKLSDNNNEFIAIFTPNDTKNYNSVEVELLVNIIKENSKNDNYKVNYNQNEVEQEDDYEDVLIFDIKNKDELVYNINESNKLFIEIDDSYDLLVKKIFIDDNELTVNDYELDNSNIIINGSYLDKLKEGKHSIKILYENNVEINEFFEVFKDNKNIDKNKSNNNIIIIILFIIVIVCGLVFLIFKRRNK